MLEYYILSGDWQILNHWKGLQRQDSQYRKPALIKDNSQAIFERILEKFYKNADNYTSLFYDRAREAYKKYKKNLDKLWSRTYNSSIRIFIQYQNEEPNIDNQEQKIDHQK